MTEVPPDLPPEAALPAGPAISYEILPPVLKKHVDPKAPLPLRGMGAKLLVPMSPHDAACLLYLLSFDPDEGIRTQAIKSTVGMPEKIALTALRDEGVPPPVLGWLARQIAAAGSYKLLESLLLNAATPDDALADIVALCPPNLAEIIAANQLRILRNEPLLRAMLTVSQASKSVVDNTADFAIRSGIFYADVPALVEAHRRIHGDAPPEPPGETADSILADFKHELSDDLGDDEQLEEGKKLTLIQRIANMNIAEKIKLATLGNKEARTILLRDSNKLVSVASIRSPRISEGEVVMLTNSRVINDDVMRIICANREWLKMYQVKLNLVKNPKTPLPTALKFLVHIRVNDLKDLAKNKNIPNAIQTTARNHLAKMQPGGK